MPKTVVSFVALLMMTAATASGQSIATGDGEAVYAANCASCHQATGQGVPGAFPPLVDHVPTLEAVKGGHAYLIDLLLYGLQGTIQVAGQSYSGAMPAWDQLSDQQLADTLNYISTAWDNHANLPETFTPYNATEIAARRDARLSAQQLYEARQVLELGAPK